MADVYVAVGKMSVLSGKAVSKPHAKDIDKVMKAAATKALDAATGYTTKGSGKPEFTVNFQVVALKVDKKTSCTIALTLYGPPKGLKLGDARKSAEETGATKTHITKCVGKVMKALVSDAVGKLKAATSGAIGVELAVNAKSSKPLAEAATKASMTKVATAALKAAGRPVVKKNAKYSVSLKLVSLKIDEKANTLSCKVSAGVGPPGALPRPTITETYGFRGDTSLQAAAEAIEGGVKAAIKSAKASLV